MVFGILGVLAALIWLMISLLSLPVPILVLDLFIIFGMLFLAVGARQQGQRKMMYLFFILTGLYAGFYLILLTAA
ncbi:hypothetical protein [Alkalicoccus saliphilus]|uniref:DUF3953 domain-containing protein n=1 Tax=Alkalicoccus saliphilus TaxID=200989 RepID=A0A2T4U9R9_9BACI|nr:hypothetical protein [Alkalicoccus saliphilus]PTL40146.1 hypothetical protein C6Y45_01845 [Alkalicoccus saliphilus]